MTKTKTFRTFTENLPTILRKNIFSKISPKSFSQGLLFIFKFSENCPRTYREFPEEIIAHEFYQKHFPEFYNFPKFSENLETIFVNVRFQFCITAEFIEQDGAVLPDDQPIKLRETRAG